MKKFIYMDNHATTQVDPRVLEVMLPYFSEHFGNPASRQHRFGWIAEEAVESSRSKIARYLNIDPSEIVFTSGATESNNLALKGIAEFYTPKGNHIITSSIEHKSILDTCKHLEKKGYKITYLPVNEFGIIDLQQLEDSINENTILVSIIYANNEIGTIQDIYQIGEICSKHNVLFHTDATQIIGKINLDLRNTKIDMLTFSGHKIYGPKGIGVLFIKNKTPKIKIIPQIDGGGHERGIRSGTLNVPAIVGLAKSLELCYELFPEENQRIAALRDKMQNEFFSRLDEVYLNGHPTNRIPNNLNVSFLYVEDTALMMAIKEIAVSSGSACSTAQQQSSHVLKALNISQERIHSAIRFGLGRFNTADEVDYVIERIINEVKNLRKILPMYNKNRKVNI